MATLQLDRLPRNATPGEVVRFVLRYGKLDGVRLGPVAILGSTARFEVADKLAVLLLPRLDGATFRDYPVRVRLITAIAHAEPNAVSRHFDHLGRLLKLEADAEREQLRERARLGLADDSTSLAGLYLRGEDVGLGGRIILTFARGNRAEALPPNRLQSGAPVVLSPMRGRGAKGHRGVVLDRTERTIAVAFDAMDFEAPDGAAWRLDLSPDEAGRLRQQAALHRVAAASRDRLAELRDVLLAQRPYDGGPAPDARPTGDSPLNGPQEAAVRWALAAPDVALIHGPPGTGKTTTLVELIRRAVAQGEKVLACAPSNAAVDNMLAKLLAAGEKPVRVGHPARVAEELRGRTLDVLVEAHPDARQARKFAREAHALLKKAERWTKDKPAPGEKQSLRSEARDLLGIARRTEQLAVERILAGANIVCGTLTGLDSDLLGQLRFGLVVIDEACQSTEPACWVPLVRADRVVLAGDPCQLPPTVISHEAADAGLAVSLMERAMATLGARASRLLTLQYRMNDAIMAFSSSEFYANELVAHESVADHRLIGLDSVTASPLTENVITFIDTAGASYDEAREPDSASRLNPQEAALTAQVVTQLLARGVPATEIAVITPYSGQVRALRDLLAGTGVEVDSVDGFQGREKEAVVLSLVRSNAEGQIGFLGEARRLNVALTRARRSLTLVGDSATLANHEFLKRLVEYFEGHGTYASVWDLAPLELEAGA